MAKPKNIQIDWTYPKTFDSAWESDQSYGRGIYQITRLFGSNESLLYLELVKSEYRNFYQRLEEHLPWLELVRGTIFIRFGKVVPRQGFTLTEEIIETIEGVLIYEHQPAENTSKKNSYTIHSHLLITNTGYRGKIKKCLDTRL